MDGKNGLNLEDFNFDAEELNKDMEVEYSDVPDIFAMNFNAEPEGEQGNENDLLNQMDAPEPEDNFDKLSPAGMKAYGKDPFFDTMHLMKRTKVYGEQRILPEN